MLMIYSCILKFLFPELTQNDPSRPRRENEEKIDSDHDPEQS